MSKTQQLHNEFMALMKEYAAQGVDAPVVYTIATFFAAVGDEGIELRAMIEAQSETIAKLSDRLAKLEQHEP